MNPVIGGAPPASFQMPTASVNGGNPLAQYQQAPQGPTQGVQQSAAPIAIPAAHLGANPEQPGFGTGGFVMSPSMAGQQQPQGMPQLNLQLLAQSAAPQFQPAPAFQPQQPQQFAAPQQQAPAPSMFGQPAGQFQFNDGMSLGGAAGGFVPTAGQPFPQQVPQPQSAFGFPQQQQQPFVPPQPAPIRDSLVQRGINVGHYTSDAELLNDLGTVAQSAQQIQAQAAWAAANAQQQPQPGQQQQQPPQAGGQQQQPGGQQQAPTKPQAPEWNPEWSQFVRVNPQSGLYETVSPHVNPMLAQRANEYRSWQRAQAEKLITDPMSVIGPDIEAKLAKIKDDAKAEVRQEIAVERRREAGARAVDDFVEKNKSAFFVHDATGKPAVNPITGQFQFTARGQAAMTYASQYRTEFANRYGRAPDADDVITQVQTRLQADEARGAFGPPMQQFGGQPFQGVPQFPQQQLPAPQPFMQQPQFGGGMFVPQMPMQAPAMVPYQPQFAPQFGSQQDDVVRRAIAMQQAGHMPQPNGTIQHAMQNALAPQNPSLDFKSMLRQSAQARGISTEHFSS
jgi:hypothetical protein